MLPGVIVSHFPSEEEANRFLVHLIMEGGYLRNVAENWFQSICDKNRTPALRIHIRERRIYYGSMESYSQKEHMNILSVETFKKYYLEGGDMDAE